MLFEIAPQAVAQKKNFILQWPETESNCRHRDFQSLALPTELSGHRNETHIKQIRRLAVNLFFWNITGWFFAAIAEQEFFHFG